MDLSRILDDPLPERPRKASRSGRRDSAALSRHNTIAVMPSASASRSGQASRSASARSSKRYICHTCGHAFNSKSHLNTHDITVHKGQKPFQCDICMEFFGQRSSLKRHKSTVHEKRRDHLCNFCDKQFSTKWGLIVHVRNLHLKEKPYTCSHPSCDRQFRTLCNQGEHEARVHEIEHMPSANSGGRPSASGAGSSSVRNVPGQGKASRK